MKKSNIDQKKIIQQAQSEPIVAHGKSRRYKIGLIATLTTIVFIIAMVAVNYFIDYLTYRFVLKIDMTQDSLYEMSQDTKETLEYLEEPITITVMANKTDFQSSDQLFPIMEMLDRYQILSNGQLTVDYIDPYLNPSILEKYNSLGDVSQTDIVIESSKRFKHLTVDNLYELETDTDDDGNTQTYIVGLRAEQRLTSGILYTLADKVPEAAYLTGHGETYENEQLDALLTKGNYEVSDVNLSVQDIPDEDTLLIISQPKSDYSAEEIAKIDEYLSGQKGSAIVLYASDTPYLERLERYFTEWGVNINQELVLDSSSCLAGYPLYILPQITTVEGITDNLDSKSYCTVPSARSMDILWDEYEYRYAQALMTTTETSYGKALAGTASSGSMEKEDGDTTGPFNVAVLTTQKTTDTQLNETVNYVLFANAGMVSDSTLELSNMENATYFASFLSYITEDSDTLLIDTKDYTSTVLTVTGAQKTVLFWLLIVIIPVGTLTLGFVVWYRRRRL